MTTDCLDLRVSVAARRLHDAAKCGQLLPQQLAIFVDGDAESPGLRFLLFQTRTGVGMRAVVDDRPLARLTGSRPDRVALLAWAIGASLAALAGFALLTAFASATQDVVVDAWRIEQAEKARRAAEERGAGTAA